MGDDSLPPQVRRKGPLDALMFKDCGNGLYALRWPPVDLIAFWEDRGWVLIVSEIDVIYADLDATRRADERGPWGSWIP